MRGSSWSGTAPRSTPPPPHSRPTHCSHEASPHEPVRVEEYPQQRVRSQLQLAEPQRAHGCLYCARLAHSMCHAARTIYFTLFMYHGSAARNRDLTLPAAATASIGCCVALPAIHGGGSGGGSGGGEGGTTVMVFEEELLLGTKLMSSMGVLLSPSALAAACDLTPSHTPAHPHRHTQTRFKIRTRLRRPTSYPHICPGGERGAHPQQ